MRPRNIVIAGIVILWLCAFGYLIHTCKVKRETGRTSAVSTLPSTQAVAIPGIAERSRILNDDTGLFTHTGKPRPTYRMLGSDGKLTSQALEAAGVNSTEAVAVQAIIDATWQQMSELIRANAEPDPFRAVGIVTAYRIKPFPDAGRQARVDLRDAISGLIGQERTDQLLNSFAWTNYFAAFGRDEVYVQFFDLGGDDDEATIRAEWEHRDPATGEIIVSTEAAYDDFTRQFGTSFSIEK
jgi:hypothetical protein